nr:reverse transcriptase domain-containing protein [Tanacetum cinerariifolium]
MSADFAVIYSSVHSVARSWSIPSEDPYEEAAQQLFERASHSPEYVPRDHVPVFVHEFEHPEDLVPAEDEAPASLLPPGFLSPRIRPLSPRALGAEMNAIASSLYHSLHPSGTPPLAGIPEADIPPYLLLLDLGVRSKRVLLLLVSYQVDVCTRESSEFCTRHHDAQMDHATVRAEIEVLRSERLAYEQEGIQTREALARSESYYRALEAQVVAADDLAVQHIMRTQALEAGALGGTLEDTGTEGAVGFTRWIEKMESVFNISGCAVENKVKFAT